MNRTAKFAAVLGVAVWMSMGTMQAQQAATLTISTDKAGAKVSPTLYGLMTEEINYSYEGGLYGELVQDRTFLNMRDTVNWIPVEQGTARGSVARDTTTGPSAALAASLKITVEQADAKDAYGLRNGGWWGVPVRGNTTYTGSVWAKGDAAAVGGAAVRVSLVADDSGKVLASYHLPALTADWKQYNFTMKTGAIAKVTAANHILLSVQRPGTVWVQQLSVFPPTYKNRVNGNRVDLMELLAGMHPAFLRFPGGNYLEGQTIADRFDWKKTIGPLVDRPGHASPWRYHSTDGMGLLEFLEWCEDLKMQPVLAVYAGYSLGGEHVTPGPDLEPYVQDALDEIEYVTGDVTTKWGAERAQGRASEGVSAEVCGDRQRGLLRQVAELRWALHAVLQGDQGEVSGAATDFVVQCAGQCGEERDAGPDRRPLLQARGGVLQRRTPLRQGKPQRAEDLCGRVGDARGHADDQLRRGAGRCGVDDRDGAQQRPDS